MVVFSKLKTIDTSCMEYVHPWTNSCSEATACLGVHALQDSFRIYVTVYMLALLMRGKVPTPKDIKRTLLGISQSTAFLTCHAASFSMCACLLRKLFGTFNVWSVAFLPAFISSYFSILVERSSRRGMLSLYVTNVASETLFRMAVWRGLVTPIKHGEVIIFMTSMAALLCFYKGQHAGQDSIYSLLRFLVGPYEEEDYLKNCEKAISEGVVKKHLEDHTLTDKKDGKIRSKLMFHQIARMFCLIIERIKGAVKCLGKHHLCPHPYSCTYYTLQSFTKLFSVGYGLQVCLQLLIHAKKIIQNPRMIPKQLLHKDAFRFGAFLGGFSGIYRMISCILRRLLNSDSKYNALPAGLLAGLTFAFFPFNTIALYVMWKTLQMVYNNGVEKGYLPELPGATLLLYCLSTATLFHAALLEPQNLRPSYWRFLFSLSGGRVAGMSRTPLDSFGLETSKSLAEVIIKAKTPLIPMDQF